MIAVLTVIHKVENGRELSAMEVEFNVYALKAAEARYEFENCPAGTSNSQIEMLRELMHKAWDDYVALRREVNP